MPDTMMTPEMTTERPSLKNLAAALCKAQADMEGAKKDAKNPHFNSKYADLASVWDAIREPLTKNGLSIVQLPRSMQGGVEVETILLHISGESLSSVLAVPASKSDAQGFGSALTYARRYSLMAMVGVAPEDDDGNAASHKPGLSGSAGGGGDFRPAGPRKFQGGPVRTDAALSEAIRDGLTTAAPAAKPAAATGKKSAADKAKEWTDKAIQALKLPGQHVESLDAWWKAQDVVPEGAKFSPLGWLEEAAPDEYERLTTTFTEIRANAKQVAA